MVTPALNLMTCALFTIGTELTRGELHNTNSGWLAEKLSELGYEVTEMLTVDDDDERMIESLRRLSAKHQIVITTGGLGPTTDDRTSACAAQAFNQPLTRDEKCLDEIRQLFESHGRVMSPSNEKQADFPEGAQVLPNARGTAPGFYLEVDDSHLFFTPGVPGEMKPMFEQHIVPLLPPPERQVATARLRTFGLPESQVNDLLAGLEEDHQITIGYRASHSEIEVKVLAQARPAESQDALQKRAEAVADLVEQRLGEAVYARGKSSLPAEIGRQLMAKGASLGLAESCTGGLVAELITQVPGASSYFHGGIVSYSNAVKEKLLKVDPQLLVAHGAVSEEVVRAMAEGARSALNVDYSLSLSGIAGPGGGSEEKPVGLVHWAVAGPTGVFAFQRVFRGDRSQVQRRAALSGLWSLRKMIKEESLAP